MDAGRKVTKGLARRKVYEDILQPLVLQQYKEAPNFLRLLKGPLKDREEFIQSSEQYEELVFDLYRMSPQRLTGVGRWMGFPFNPRVDTYERWRSAFFAWLQLKGLSGMNNLLTRLQLMSGFQHVDWCRIYPAAIGISQDGSLMEWQINSVLPAGVAGLGISGLCTILNQPLQFETLDKSMVYAGHTVAESLVMKDVAVHTFEFYNVDMVQVIFTVINSFEQNITEYARIYRGVDDNRELVENARFTIRNGASDTITVEIDGYEIFQQIYTFNQNNRNITIQVISNLPVLRFVGGVMSNEGEDSGGLYVTIGNTIDTVLVELMDADQFEVGEIQYQIWGNPSWGMSPIPGVDVLPYFLPSGHFAGMRLKGRWLQPSTWLGAFQYRVDAWRDVAGIQYMATKFIIFQPQPLLIPMLLAGYDNADSLLVNRPHPSDHDPDLEEILSRRVDYVTIDIPDEDTVVIGQYRWMAKDLHLRGGSSAGGLFSIWRDDDNGTRYFSGTTMQNLIQRGVIPEGWRVPTGVEWQNLRSELDYSLGSYYGQKIAKENAWPYMSPPANNEFGFNAVPTGYFSGGSQTWEAAQQFWAWSDDNYYGDARAFILQADGVAIMGGSQLNNYLPIRLVKDLEYPTLTIDQANTVIINGLRWTNYDVEVPDVPGYKKLPWTELHPPGDWDHPYAPRYYTSSQARELLKCFPGWRLPTSQEFAALPVTTALKKVNAVPPWPYRTGSPDTNSTGFSAIPYGRSGISQPYEMDRWGEQAFWWYRFDQDYDGPGTYRIGGPAILYGSPSAEGETMLISVSSYTAAARIRLVQDL